MAKFEFGRFYIHTRGDDSPADRLQAGAQEKRYLVAIAHGYFVAGSGKTKVRGVRQVGFGCNHERTVQPSDFEAWIEALPGQDNFHMDRTLAGEEVYNYTLQKELQKSSKGDFKGKANYEFVDSSYIDSIFPKGAGYDIVGIHNTWSSGRTVKLSDLFTMLETSVPLAYTHLVCGFCREIKD